MDWRKIEAEIANYIRSCGGEVMPVGLGSTIYVDDGSYDGLVDVSLSSLARHLADNLKPEMTGDGISTLVRKHTPEASSK